MMAGMWLLVMVLAVTAVVLFAWASGMALRFARKRQRGRH
jgi:hypothetical protein